MAVYGYARVSTAAQADRGGSILGQRMQITAYAAMKELDDVEIAADEGVTGSTRASSRPAAGALLEKLQAGDHLVVTKVDRLFRSARDALNVVGDLNEKGIHIHIIELGGLIADTEPMPKMFLAFLGIMAEWELGRIRERVAEGKARAKVENKFPGGNPRYGFRPGADNILEPDPDQQAVIDLLSRMWREGKTQGIGAQRLAEMLVRLHGVPISKKTVARIIGELQAKRDELTAQMPARKARRREVLDLLESEEKALARKKKITPLQHRQRMRRRKERKLSDK